VELALPRAMKRRGLKSPRFGVQKMGLDKIEEERVIAIRGLIS